jgi:hypothetical protein
MLEQILDNFRAIIYNNLPKNSLGNPYIMDREIKHYYFGDRTIIEETPSLLFTGKKTDEKKKADGIYELTHNISIGYWEQGSRNEISARRIFEFTRLIYENIKSQRIMWVTSPCPICLKKFLSPVHITTDHVGITSSYVTTATTNLNNLWLESHFSGDTAPTFPSSGIAYEAFNLLYNDVVNNVTVPGITTSMWSNFQTANTNKLKILRLVYDIQYSDITLEDFKEKQLLTGGEFSITMKETVYAPTFGPDNVDTTAYSWTPIIG